MRSLSKRDLKRLGPEARRLVQIALQQQARTDGDSMIGAETTSSPNKYHNIPTTVDNITFPSEREAQRYAELCLELLTGEIENLRLQKVFSLDVNGVHICNYVADFVYERGGRLVVEDAKGERLDIYRLKRCLMKAIFGIDVTEV